MPYVDGFVIPVPKKNIPTYVKIASLAGKVWMEHGALAYYETVGDELMIDGCGSFLEPHKCQKDETIVFAWILYKSKADRNRVNKLVMADPRLTANMDPNKMPFDVKRMCYGGFEPLVALAAKPKAKGGKAAKAKTAKSKTMKARATRSKTSKTSKR